MLFVNMYYKLLNKYDKSYIIISYFKFYESRENRDTIEIQMELIQSINVFVAIHLTVEKAHIRTKSSVFFAFTLKKKIG